jgi:hypothetical protein
MCLGNTGGGLPIGGAGQGVTKNTLVIENTTFLNNTAWYGTSSSLRVLFWRTSTHAFLCELM